jgi:glucosamine--fructose-6-phosphate aminotransferase (isomerizing)
MCGIFAVSGDNKKAGELVLAGLKKLEYRGYDSWGIATNNDENIVSIKKSIGKISEANPEFTDSVEAMGHSRWATHGGVTKANAHPHKSGKITVVHNGIFENYTKYKKQLIKKGYEFKSETDTEVIAVLINDFCSKQNWDLKKAIIETAKLIKGRFALLVMQDGLNGIYAIRRGSPLIIGRAKNATFIASDIPAFLDKTNVINYLDDNEMVFIQKNSTSFFNLETKTEIEKRFVEVPWKIEEAEKGNFDHFMIKEIFDQKDSIARAINHNENILEKAINLLEECNGVYFLACGTAHKVAMTAEYYFAQVSGRKINVVPASEMAYFERFINEKTAIIAVSQSGETADVLEIIEKAKKNKAKILSLTNVESSSIARISDVHLPINAGPEKAVASTKAATSQMALLLLLAYADVKKVNLGKEVLRNTASAINDLLNPRYENYIKEVAETIVSHDHLFIIGRGSLYPMALESAIKIQEVSYINAQGFAAGELKHGPIALIEKGIPCLVLGDDLETISNATELQSRGAYLIGVAPNNADIFDAWLKIPECFEAKAIASIIPVQILSYYLATLRGLNPDMPRNLAKSVTVK